MSMERARELVSAIEDLPTLPEVVIEVTRLVENPDTTAEDVYRVVSTDVSLSATMLKLVNSAFYGVSRSVTSLQTAIRILGFATVRNLALAAFVFDAFLTGGGRLDYKGFWLRSIGIGAAAKTLARRLRAAEAGEYFVYGLLHNLGVVVLMQYLPREFAGVRSLIAAGKRPAQAEDEVCGCTHQELGAALAERWDFPPGLVTVIGHDSEADLPEEYALETAVISCAEALAAALEVGEGVEPRVPAVRAEAWKTAGATEPRMGAILDEVLAGMEESRHFIELLYR